MKEGKSSFRSAKKKKTKLSKKRPNLLHKSIKPSKPH